MLFTGIVLGPYVLNLLDPSILGISSELRQMALIIILLKAGLSLNLFYSLWDGRNETESLLRWFFYSAVCSPAFL